MRVLRMTKAFELIQRKDSRSLPALLELQARIMGIEVGAAQEQEKEVVEEQAEEEGEEAVLVSQGVEAHQE